MNKELKSNYSKFLWFNEKFEKKVYYSIHWNIINMSPAMVLGPKLTKLSFPIIEFSSLRPYSSALSNAFYNSE